MQSISRWVCLQQFLVIGYTGFLPFMRDLYGITYPEATRRAMHRLGVKFAAQRLKRKCAAEFSSSGKLSHMHILTWICLFTVHPSTENTRRVMQIGLPCSGVSWSGVHCSHDQISQTIDVLTMSDQLLFLILFEIELDTVQSSWSDCYLIFMLLLS